MTSIYDPRVLTTVYKKTNVNNQLKHLKRLNQKKPNIVVRRIMDSKGRYSRTEIDIRSQCEVLIEIHRGAEGLDLLIAKFSRLWSAPAFFLFQRAQGTTRVGKVKRHTKRSANHWNRSSPSLHPRGTQNHIFQSSVIDKTRVYHLRLTLDIIPSWHTGLQSPRVHWAGPHSLTRWVFAGREVCMGCGLAGLGHHDSMASACKTRQEKRSPGLRW